MYRGTRFATNCAPKRCKAPKTASGIAKHKLLKATILSRPRAAATSFFAANAPIKNSAMPAEHKPTAVGEVPKNVAGMAGCIGSPIRYRVSDSTTKPGLRNGWATPRVVKHERVGHPAHPPGYRSIVREETVSSASKYFLRSVSTPGFNDLFGR